MDKKEETLQKLKERIDQNKGITYKIMQQEDMSLFNAIQRYWKSLTNACNALGISTQEMKDVYGFTNNIDKRLLTEDEIIERLTYLKSIGKLTTNAMRTQFEDTRLERSIKKKYGSVAQCFDDLGLKRDRKVVTKESIKAEIINHRNNGDELFYSNMIEVNSALVSNATKKYNMGWHELLDYLGFDYKAKRQSFSHDSIKERLNVIENEYGTINYNILKKHDSSILYYAHTTYGSLPKLMNEMGYECDEYFETNTNIHYGFKFESIVKEILDALKIENIYNKAFTKGIRPDFQLKNNVWLDCKLSSWTLSTEDTVHRYLKYCDKIIIVYLRGVPYKFKGHEKYNVVFRNVSYFYPMLEEINRQDLISKCQGILSEIEKLQESVTTERSIPSRENDGKVTV